VLLWNNAKYDALGVGESKIRMHDTIVRRLTNVRHVLESKKTNILSALDLIECWLSSYSRVMKVVRDSEAPL